MLGFTARDTPNGEIEERGHRLDETAPVTKPDGRRPTGRRGQRRSRLEVPESQALFSFVSKTRQLIFVFARTGNWP
jgi:hypothetical protein